MQKDSYFSFCKTNGFGAHCLARVFQFHRLNYQALDQMVPLTRNGQRFFVDTVGTRSPSKKLDVLRLSSFTKKVNTRMCASHGGRRRAHDTHRCSLRLVHATSIGITPTVGAVGII